MQINFPREGIVTTSVATFQFAIQNILNLAWVTETTKEIYVKYNGGGKKYLRM